MTTISAGSAFYKVQAALDDNSNKVAKSMERLATGRRGVTAGDRPCFNCDCWQYRNTLGKYQNWYSKSF